MKNLKRILLISSLTLGFCVVSQAQMRLAGNYNIGIPVGALGKKFSQPSFRGAGITMDYEFPFRLSIGLTYRYQSYWQRYERQEYVDKTTITSAVVTRVLTNNNFLVQFGYDYPLSKIVSVYGAVGLGVARVSSYEYWGVLRSNYSKVCFDVEPEVGFRFKILKPLDITVGVRYAQTFYKAEGYMNNLGYIQPFVTLRLSLTPYDETKEKKAEPTSPVVQ